MIKFYDGMCLQNKMVCVYKTKLYELKMAADILDRPVRTYVHSCTIHVYDDYRCKTVDHSQM